jgi:hypothetical protein
MARAESISPYASSGNTCISQPFTMPSCRNEARSASSYSRNRCPGLLAGAEVAVALTKSVVKMEILVRWKDAELLDPQKALVPRFQALGNESAEPCQLSRRFRKSKANCRGVSLWRRVRAELDAVSLAPFGALVRSQISQVVSRSGGAQNTIIHAAAESTASAPAECHAGVLRLTARLCRAPSDLQTAAVHAPSRDVQSGSRSGGGSR